MFPKKTVQEELEKICIGSHEEWERQRLWQQWHPDNNNMLRRWLVYNAEKEKMRDDIGHFYYICLGVLMAPILIAWRESSNIYVTDPTVVATLVPKLDFLDVFPLVNITDVVQKEGAKYNIVRPIDPR